MVDGSQFTKGKQIAAEDSDDLDSPTSRGAEPPSHRWHAHQANYSIIRGTTGAASSSWIGGTAFPSRPHIGNGEHNNMSYQEPNVSRRPCYREQLNILVETSLRSLTIRDRDRGEGGGLLLTRGRRNNLYGWVNHGRQHGQAQQAAPVPAADPYAGRRLGDVKRGTMSSVARSLPGCRFLARMVAEGGAAAAQQVLEEVAGEIARLMVHSVAHTVVEKLVEHGAGEQITRVLYVLAASPDQIVTVARNHAGSNILQALIDRIAVNPRHVELFTSALAHTGEHAVALLIQHADGSRLIIRCLDTFSAYQNRFITVVVTSSRFFHRVCRDRHGCNVVNRCIDKAAGDKQLWNSLVVAVCMDGLALAEHGYGNYIVQHVIRSVPEARDWLHTAFRGHYVSLSRQTASSHVVQRCLEFFSSEQVDEIVRELLGCHHWGCRFPQLISDPYANYVLQTAMRRREVRMHNALLDAINMHRNLLRDDWIAREVFRTLRKVLSSVFHM